MAEHVRLQPPATFICLHCGERYAAAMPAPIDVFAGIAKTFEKTHKKCKLPASGRPACEHCGGFDHPVGKCPRTDYRGDPQRWREGPDTGTSSLAIWHVMMGRTPDRDDPPWDPSDFGRCHRLLHAIPGWRARIGEMAKVKGWKRLAPAWDELEALYVEELPSGKAPKLWARMQALTSRGG